MTLDDSAGAAESCNAAKEAQCFELAILQKRFQEAGNILAKDGARHRNNPLLQEKLVRALGHAVATDCPETASFALRHGADLRAAKHYGPSEVFPLISVAAQKCSAELVFLLADAWTGPLDARDTLGRTVLHAVLDWEPKHQDDARDNRLIMRKLVEKGAPVNAQDNVGDTIFHLAMQRPSLETAAFMLDIGANPYIRNKFWRHTVAESVRHRFPGFDHAGLEALICRHVNARISRVVSQGAQHSTRPVRSPSLRKPLGRKP